jgi:transglutaminase-like putative cysteine protease
MNKTISYSGMLWLLAAQFIVMLPFIMYLPWWLMPIMVAAVIWRLRVLKGYSAQPSSLVKTLLVTIGVGGLVMSGLPFPSLDIMLSVLLLGFAFKSLEVLTIRDAIIVIFLGYLLVALHFLYTQEMLAGLYGILGMTILTGAMIGVQPSVTVLNPLQTVRSHLKLAALMLLQAVPLMLIVFFLAPRLPPLWSLPMMPGQTKTGISERMTPGDIADLTRSTELAFRVNFKSTRPKQAQLYWRGLTLNYFDGKTWQQLPEDYDFINFKNQVKGEYALNSRSVELRGDPIEYEALYAPSGQPWLFTLTPALNVEGEVSRVADYRVMANSINQAPILIKASSYPQSVRDLKLSHTLRRLASQLPLGSDPRTHELAQKWWRESGENVDQYIQLILGHFKREEFYYTLSPPLLGDQNTIDAFLFDSRKGFCSHYAGSFVFLMRAVGIPARVVVGYQGGKWNEQGNYLAVHQYDAHAWVEIWQPETGWTEYDPTTAVAPSRITDGLDSFLEQQEGLLHQSFRAMQNNLPWLSSLTQQLDYLQYQWQRWIVGYDQDTQGNLLREWLGDFSVKNVIFALLGLFGGLALIWTVWLGLWKKPKLTVEQALVSQFDKVLAKQGFQRNPAQTMRDFIKQVSAKRADLSQPLQQFAEYFEHYCYDPEANKTQTLKQLQQVLKTLKRIKSTQLGRNIAPLRPSRISEG